MTMPMSSSAEQSTASERLATGIRRLRRLIVFQGLAVITVALYYFASQSNPHTFNVSPAVVAVAIFGVAFVLIPQLARAQLKRTIVHSVALSAVVALLYLLFNPVPVAAPESIIVEVLVGVLLIVGTLFSYLRFRILLTAYRYHRAASITEPGAC